MTRRCRCLTKVLLLTVLCMLCACTAVVAEGPQIEEIIVPEPSVQQPVEPLMHTVDMYHANGELFYSMTVPEGLAIEDPLVYPSEPNAVFLYWYDPAYGTEPYIFGTPAYGPLALWPYFEYLPVENPVDAWMPSIEGTESSGFVEGITCADPNNILMDAPLESEHIVQPDFFTQETGNTQDAIDTLAQSIVETAAQPALQEIPVQETAFESMPQTYADAAPMPEAGMDASSITTLPVGDEMSRVGIDNNAADGPQIVALPVEETQPEQSSDIGNLLAAFDIGTMEAEKDPTLTVLPDDITEEEQKITQLPVGEDEQARLGIVTGGDGDMPSIVVLPLEEDQPTEEEVTLPAPGTEQPATDQPQAETLPQGQPEVAITANVQGAEVRYGDTISLTGAVSDMEADAGDLCWEYSDGGEWVDTGVRGLAHSFVLDAENYHWAWRLVARVEG